MREISYIEFVGLPGAGKTEVARRAVERARATGVAMRVRTPIGRGPFLRLWLSLRVVALCVTRPVLWSLCTLSVRPEYRSAPHVRKIVRDLALRTIVDTVVVRHLLGRGHDQLVNDEGLVGKVVALSVLANLSEARGHRILATIMPKPIRVVFVDVDPRRAMEREQSRAIELPFFNDMDQSSKERFFVESAAAYQRLREGWNRSENVEVLRLQNDGTTADLDVEVEQLVDRLRTSHTN